MPSSSGVLPRVGTKTAAGIVLRKEGCATLNCPFAQREAEPLISISRPFRNHWSERGIVDQGLDRRWGKTYPPKSTSLDFETCIQIRQQLFQKRCNFSTDRERASFAWTVRESMLKLGPCFAAGNGYPADVG